jgi:hypothetical protein
MSARDDPVQLVGSLMAGFVDSRCLHVVANLGIADAVGEEPVLVAELAAELGVDLGSLTRLLRLIKGPRRGPSNRRGPATGRGDT